MKNTLINGRWELMLPDHRADRPEWPWWEATRLAAMNHFINPEDVVWDIGAEEGDFPALFALWGAEVVLVEPNPLVWPNIKAIFEANMLSNYVLGGFVGFASDTIADAQVGLTVETATFSETRWPLCAHDEIIGNHGFRHLAQETDTTPRVTLDALCERFPPPQHITIDVEGSELRVLDGATNILVTDRPYVWVSVHAGALREFYNQDPWEVIELMEALRYRRVFLTYDHEEHNLFVPNEKCWPL